MVSPEGSMKASVGKPRAPNVSMSAGAVPASVGARPVSAAGAVRLRGEAARVILL